MRIQELDQDSGVRYRIPDQDLGLMDECEMLISAHNPVAEVREFKKDSRIKDQWVLFERYEIRIQEQDQDSGMRYRIPDQDYGLMAECEMLIRAHNPMSEVGEKKPLAAAGLLLPHWTIVSSLVRLQQLLLTFFE